MKSWPELIGSGNPEAHDYAAGAQEQSRTMLAKVALALAKEDDSHQCGAFYFVMARVAIEAMREPTPEILRVMAAPFVATGRAVTVSEYWRSLIDAALKE